MTVATRKVRNGVEIRGTVQIAAPLEADLVRAIELGSPGDTGLMAGDQRVVVTRFLAEPTQAAVHEAKAEVDKTLSFIALLTSFPPQGQGGPPGGTRRNATMRCLCDDSTLGPLLERFRTVRVTQPGWPSPDASRPPSAAIGRGVWLQVLERRGDWALVRSENGDRAWTDARNLVTPSIEGDPP